MRIAMKPVTQRLLVNKDFDIEFNGYLSNHVKHAIIALQGLDASDDRIQGYWDSYTKETPYNIKLDPVKKKWDNVKPLRDVGTDWFEVRGKKIQWQEQVASMNVELESLDGSSERLVAKYVDPSLIDGIAGALTHGIIHLGWAIDADCCDWMVCEGLAYLNFCHVGVDPAKFVESKTEHTNEKPIDSFVRVAEVFENQNLKMEWVEPVKQKYGITFHPELVAAGFQWEVSKLLHEPHPIVVELPSWITNDNNDVEKTWENLYRCVMFLYLATRDNKDGHGNFVVLHLITSLWALENVCRVVDKLQTAPSAYAVRRRAWSQFYATAVVLLSASSGGFPSPSSLISIQNDFPESDKDGEDFDWTPIVNAGIAEEEEHNIKLVYVCRELWHRYSHWTGFSAAANSFTLTPQIGGGAFKDEMAD